MHFMLFYILKIFHWKLGVIACDCNSNTMKAEAEDCNFSVFLSCIEGSREAWAAWWDLIEENKQIFY